MFGCSVRLPYFGVTRLRGWEVPAIFIGGALALEKKPDRGQAVASDDFDEELMDYGEDDGEDDEDGGL